MSRIEVRHAGLPRSSSPTRLIKNTVEREEWKDFRQVMLPGHDGHSFYPTRRKVAQLEPITSSYISPPDNRGDAVLDLTLGPSPAWQIPPPTDTEIVNFNYASDEVFAKLAVCQRTGRVFSLNHRYEERLWYERTWVR
jgi:hypothetical protein